MRPYNKLLSDRLTFAQFPDVADEGMDGVLIQSVSPTGHAGCSSDRQAALLDGIEQLGVGAGLKIIRLRVIAGRYGQQFSVDAIALARHPMTLGAIPLVHVSGFFGDRVCFEGRGWRRRRGLCCLWRCRWDNPGSFPGILPTAGQ